MKRWKKYAAGLMLMAGLSPQARAQVPAAPAAAAPAAGAPAAAPAAAPGNMWSFICLTPEQKQACKEKICNCALGQMLNNGLKPMGAFSGGIIGPFCPAVTAADMAKPADSAEGAAARIKADEADAKARREAVRFLGTVDCNYWPEATEALVNALRGDRNECVRLEAAYALGRGCCCNKMTIRALVLCVSRSDEDGFPRECSERVRATAHAALAHCLSCYTEVVPVVETKDGKEPPPPPPSKGEGKPTTPAEYYKHVQGAPRQQLIEESERALSHPTSVAPPSMAPGVGMQEKSSDGLFGIIQHAFAGPSGAAPIEQPVVARQPLMKTLLPSRTTTTNVTYMEPPASPLASAPKVEVSAPVVTTTPAALKPIPPAAVQAPAPVVSAPAAAPVVSTPAPAPAVRTPAPAPVVSTPAPVPSVSRAPTPAVAPIPIAPPKPAPVPAPAPVPVQPVGATQPNNGMNMTMPEVVTMLRDSSHAEYREWAATNLATVDGWTNPDVVKALAQAARTDQNPTVRAACVRTLGKMRCATLPVMSAVQAAKGDSDLKVRQEADKALQLITVGDGPALSGAGGR
jgi:hypothetical protein